MIFNCLSCCKAISSTLEACPYCMIELSGMLRAVEVKPVAQSRPILQPATAARAAKANPLWDADTLELSIQNMIETMRAAKTPARHAWR